MHIIEINKIQVSLKKIILWAVICFPLSFHSTIFANEIQVLTTLDEHRDILKSSLQEAQKRVVIVSPYISKWAIIEDKIVDLVKRKHEEKVKVTIYTDCRLDRYLKTDNLKYIAKDGRELLRKAYINLRILNKVHAKVLIKDDDMIVIGSFNWLSAARNLHSDHSNLEQSIVVRGLQAAGLIATSLAGLETLEEVETPYSEALDKNEDDQEGDILDKVLAISNGAEHLPHEEQEKMTYALRNIANSSEESESDSEKESESDSEKESESDSEKESESDSELKIFTEHYSEKIGRRRIKKALQKNNNLF